MSEYHGNQRSTNRSFSRGCVPGAGLHFVVDVIHGHDLGRGIWGLCVTVQPISRWNLGENSCSIHENDFLELGALWGGGRGGLYRRASHH